VVKLKQKSWQRISNCFMSKPWFIIGILLLSCFTVTAQKEPSLPRNIVLVHGAWADGSGWKGVYDILVKDGYRVSIVQEPETSFKEDVTATKRVIAQQDGPCVVVAHSYGGAVLTEAANDPKVMCIGLRRGPHARCRRE
jgi:pimeloyl-ACP methyl ester carboxylesterase